MLLFEIARLPRPRRFELLSALRGLTVDDDGTLDDFAVAREIVDALRGWLIAPEGQLVEIQRRRLIEFGDALNIMRFPGFEPYEEIDSYDFISDRQLARAVVSRTINESQAIAEGGTTGAISELLGRRLLALGARADQTLFAALQLRALATGETQSTRSQAEEMRAAREGRADDLDLEPEGNSVAEVVGLWLATGIYESSKLFEAASPDRKFEILPLAVPPVSELLAALVLGFDLVKASASRKPTSSAQRNRESAPISGVAAASARTRARRSRHTRGIAALGLCTLIDMPPPDPAF